MTWLAQRIIAYLQSDTTLTTLLGSSDNIFVESAPLRKEKYITISPSIGKDQNSINVDIGQIRVTANVSRIIENAHSICLTIIGRVDDLLNKGEINLATNDYKILHFLRIDDMDLQVDDASGEYFYTLIFEFILAKGS